MIQLDEKYRVHAAPEYWSLVEIRQGKRGQTEVVVGYYATLPVLLRAYLDRKSKNCGSIEAVLASWADSVRNVEVACACAGLSGGESRMALLAASAPRTRRPAENPGPDTFDDL